MSDDRLDETGTLRLRGAPPRTAANLNTWLIVAGGLIFLFLAIVWATTSWQQLQAIQEKIRPGDYHASDAMRDLAIRDQRLSVIGSTIRELRTRVEALERDKRGGGR